MRILFLGEIIGKAGQYTVKKALPALKEELNIDFVIAGGNATTNCAGMGKNHALYLRKLGVNLLAGGDMIFNKTDLVEDFDKLYFVMRPANLSQHAVGKGLTFPSVGSHKITVLNLLGQSGYNRLHASNPFTLATDLLTEKIKHNAIKIVIFNAIASAEKKAMGYHMSGLASCVVGYGGRAMTADSRIENDSAIISDLGRVGSRHSVGGLDAKNEINRFLLARPLKNIDSWLGLELNGVWVEIDDESGKALSINIIRKEIESPATGEET